MAAWGMIKCISPIFCALALGAASASAQVTAVFPNPDQEGAAYQANYSQAVMLQALLYDSDGPVSGERLEFSMQRGDDESTSFLISDPQTDAAGRATARLTLVNGRYGGQDFVGAEVTPENLGERYVITIHFPGTLEATDPLCQFPTGDGGTADEEDAGVISGLCPSTDQVELFIGLETVTLELEPGNRVSLSDEITLLATLSDPNGDAATAGTEVNGDGARPLSDRTISFYFDLDGNGSPSIDERLGNTQTNQDGIASFNFFADPAIIPAGDFETGLHTQFGGDDYFAFAGGSARATVDPGSPDAARTLIEIEPESAPADGTTLVTLNAILVDEAGNVLGIDSPDYLVSFDTTLGTIQGDGAERDLLTGYYTQDMLAPREAGSATVTVSVDGITGADESILFTDNGGCGCAATNPRQGDAVPFFLGTFILGLGYLSRRRNSCD
jgi:hypothetical protein